MFFMCLSVIGNTQEGGGFKITKSTIDAGGGESEGGSFVVTGTIGQADASNKLIGGGFALTGGFWSSGVVMPKPDAMFKDGFED